jgi:hypothetical protein
MDVILGLFMPNVYTLAFANPTVPKLKRMFNITDVPRVVILKMNKELGRENFEVISSSGKEMIERYGGRCIEVIRIKMKKDMESEIVVKKPSKEMGSDHE